MADIEIEVTFLSKTEMAIMLENIKGDKVFIPISQISDQMGEFDDTLETIFIPEWLAVEKGLI